MLEEHWQHAAGVCLQREPHFITDYCRRGGLDCNFRCDFSENNLCKNEKREKERQERKRDSSGLMTFCLSFDK